MSQKRVRINSRDNSVTVILKKVRLSFPSLFSPRAFQEGQKAKYGATFLMPKEGDPEDNATHLKTGIKEVIKSGLKGKNPGPDKLCLRDGSVKEHLDGYGEGVYFCSASNDRKVQVVDRDCATPLGEEDGKPYAGCYVDASLRLWAQDNKFGKRVNAQLRAIRFVGDGEPFGQAPVDPEEEFDADDADFSADDDIL